MYEVVMMACTIFGQCVALQDDRGPYETFAECEARVYEMAELFEEHPLFPVPYSIRGGCNTPEPKTTI